MKKLFLLIAATIAILSASCEKKGCYKCEIETRYYSGSNVGPVRKDTAYTTVCDKTKTEIRKYENEFNNATPATYGGVTAVKYIDCK